MTLDEAKLVLDNARPQTKEIDRQFYDDEDLNNALDMAIKALEQQPCEDCEYNRGYRDGYDKGNLNGYELRKAEEKKSDDCISRQATLDAIIKELCIKDESYLLQSEKVIYNVVKNMPPVTPTQRWIPVSERLPKKTGWYFITFRFANGVAVCEASYRKPENYWTGKNISKKLFDNNEVVAWQPLPKPYEEKRGDENEVN